MEQPEKELIKEIANLFEDYEEAYVPGEWESFSAAGKRKYPFFSPWMKIAAVLLLTGSVLLYRMNEVVPVKKSTGVAFKAPVVTRPEPLFPITKNPVILKDDRIVSAGRDRGHGADLKGGTVAGRQKTVNPLVIEDTFHQDKDEQQFTRLPEISQVQIKSGEVQIGPAGVVKQEGIEGVKTRTADIAKVSSDKAKLSSDNGITANDTSALSKSRKANTLDFLLAESKSPVKTAVKKDNTSKWDFGLEVAPAVTRSSMNVGGGLTTAYRLSNKFSLSSGISILKMQAGRDVPASPNAKMAFSSISEKELTAIDTKINAIDIPIAIVYKLNKHFYTSAGISYFNVISEKRNNTYSQTSQASATFVSPQTGIAADYRVVVNESVDERSPETPLQGNSYLGFFNFSIGRRQSLFNKYNILIEPFIKIPVGKLSSEDLKLTNSGLKFQISF